MTHSPFLRRFLPLALLLTGAMPATPAVLLYSSVSVPKLNDTNPAPVQTQETLTATDNQAINLFRSDGIAYVSAYAQSGFGRLRVSAASYQPPGSLFFWNESSGLSRFDDEFLLNVPIGQVSVRFVFQFHVSQVLDAQGVAHGMDSQGLHFATHLESWTPNGQQLLSGASCGTAGGQGFVYNFQISTSATCTLDVPVTSGQVRLITTNFVQLYTRGLENPTSLDATNTLALSQTGWLDALGHFTAAQFQGDSGTLYPYIDPSSNVPEPWTTPLLGVLAAAFVLRRKH
ncbi:MAG: PEP-CTERM sorting domain-containing protein [Bryobacterales bacterium]|nr:PEP-CTERM sorting domain-containing protein [Bryobacterales bacterium]